MTDLVRLLRHRSGAQSDAAAFILVGDEPDPTVLSYGDLHARAVAVARRLLASARPGDRVLLLHPPGEGYLAAFFGCLYAGMVAVPAYPPANARGLDRLAAVRRDAGATVVLADAATSAALAGDRALPGVDVWLTPDGDDVDGGDVTVPVTADTVALLQYTSGSTGAPKGVVVDHANLMHNAATIAGAVGLGTGDVGASWLPPYHDMGLIGGILQPLHGGFPCVLMAPVTFMRRPARWLQEISRHTVTISAAPDFGYAECVVRVSDDELSGVDLRSWRHALVGAEPVRAGTLDAFARRFGPVGFRRRSFYPCYGLAEATLFVTGPAAGTDAVVHRVGRRELAAGHAVRTTGDDADTLALVGCGVPHGDTTVAIVDVPDGRTAVAAAAGRVGEIWVSGPTVARGYWNTGAEMKEVFDARLPGDARRFLRTGDLGFLRDGELVVTGRDKDLIVLRGRNHWPQDIEQTAETAHPALRPRRGIAFGYDDGERERVVLVHELLPTHRAADPGPVRAAILQAVAATHGIGLDDVVLVRSGTLPRTTSGKPQRRQCRESYLAGEFGAVAGGLGPAARDHDLDPVERLVAETLEVDPARLDRTTPLTAYGLDSLSAARLSVAVRDLTGRRIGVEALLGGATLTDLLDAPGGDPPPAAPAVEVPVAVGAPAVASFAQERMWVTDQLGGAPANTVPVALRLTGQLDVPALRSAVAELLVRHPALRTRLRLSTGGRVEQDILEPGLVELDGVELDGVEPGAPEPGAPDPGPGDWRSAAEQWHARASAASGDPAERPPVRAALLRLGSTEHVLVLSAHHSTVDAWSFTVLLTDLAELYRAATAGRPAPAPADALTYREFARRQRARDHGTSLQVWRELLAGVPEIVLPTDRPAGDGRAARAGLVPVRLPGDVVRRLNRVAQESSASLFMALLAVYAVVLSRWAEQTSFTVAVPVANRSTPDVARLVGPVMNVVPVPIDVAGEPSLRALLSRVRSTVLRVLAEAETPFELVARTADNVASGPAGLLRAALVLQNRPLPVVRLPQLSAEPLELPTPGAPFEVALHLRPAADGGLEGEVRFAAGTFDATSMNRLAGHVTRLATAATDEANVPVGALPMVTEPERRLILRHWSGAARAPATGANVVDLVERQVAATPDVVAVDGAERLTYADLDQRANRLAWHLRSLGVGPDSIVASYLRPSVDVPVALLAILKAGGAYLPIDPAYPEQRVGHVLQDAQPVLLITQEQLPRPAVPAATRVLTVGDVPADGPATRPPRSIRPEHASFVIYTSGSTGAPKGVINTHAALYNHAVWKSRAYPLGPRRTLPLKTPLGFDVSVTEVLWPLLDGARLLIPDPGRDRDPSYVAELIGQNRITDCYFVPSALRAFLSTLDGPVSGSLRRVLSIGEAMTADLAGTVYRLLPGVELHDMYGPAECCIEVIAGPVPAPATTTGRIHLGDPIDGALIYLLDEHGQPVPVGVPGEIHVGGACVGREYAGRPELTAARFLPDPFAPGGRMYRTGDRARWTAHGHLVYLGRRDFQVKLRGNRIELGEIEAALESDPGVRAAVVDVRTGPDGDPRLVAYLQCDEPPSVPRLRQELQRFLPDFMVPAVFVALAALPTGPNGKVDRAALPEPGAEHFRGVDDYVQPANLVERQMADIWSQVLGLDRVGRHDRFGSIGGHSLMAVRVAVRIRDEFGVDLPVSELMSPELTVAALSAAVQRRQLAAADSDDVRDLLRWLDDLPDEEARTLLANGWDGHGVD